MAQGDGEEVAWLDALVHDVRAWHEGILDESGGLRGEHGDRLRAACARPFQSAFGEFIFPTDFARAGALFHGIISAHVFVDGNKRTAVIVTVGFLMARELITKPDGLQIALLGEVALAAARSELDAESVAYWLERICRRTRP